MNKIKKLFIKNQQIIKYLVMGIITVAINTISFFLINMLLNNILISNIGAFILAVIFAYYTNLRYVFNKSHSMKKMFDFLCTRICTFLLDTAGIYLFVMLGFEEIIGKLIMNIIVVILNYGLSKWILFKI